MRAVYSINDEEKYILALFLSSQLAKYNKTVISKTYTGYFPLPWLQKQELLSNTRWKAHRSRFILLHADVDGTGV